MSATLSPPTEAQELKDAGVRYRKRAEQKPARPATKPPRTAYLERNLSLTKASMCAAAATAAGAPPTSREAIEQLSQERIIGSTDLVGIELLELAVAVSRSVARVRIRNGFGTGSLVGPGLLMTNHHVIGSVAEAQSAVAQFDYQVNASGDMLPRQDFRIDPAAFFVTSPELDFTIVGVAPTSSNGRPLTSYGWLKLIGELGKAETGDPVNIIQHPLGGLKQIAFRNNEIIDVPKEKTSFLYYSTDTEPGSSGAPCFNDQWEIVALHHMGVPAIGPHDEVLRKDGQPWRKGTDADSLIHWIANEGARTSAIVGALRAESLRPEWRDLRDLMLESAAPNPIELARHGAADNGSAATNATHHSLPTVTRSPEPAPVSTSASPVYTPEGASMSQSATFTVPVHITVSVGGAPPLPASVPIVVPGRSSVAAIPATTTPGEALEVVIDPDFSNREGYDSDFLGMNVPLPTLSAEQQADSVEVPAAFRKNGQRFVLNYHHYSVAMNKKRRTAWYSAGMIDGTRFRDFKRGKDKWFLDPRIPAGAQMGEELYAAANTDRGHLTRFKDLSWGGSMAEAVTATNDSFHFTNCTLQLDGFNQGKERWQGLEQFLLEQHAKKDRRRLVVITGPVLLDTDPVYRNPAMSYSTRVPLAFWKVCGLIRESDGELSATAFTLGQQDIIELPGFEERFDIGAAQVTIAEIERLTGLTFGVLNQHDHFAESNDPGTLEIAIAGGQGKRRVRPLSSLADVVV